MRSKKGILMQNALSLIIAVVGLILLFYVAYQLYFKLTSTEESESAKALADVVEAKVEAIQIGQSINTTVRGVNGESWVLAAFDLNNPNRPDACFFEPCIYICKKVSEEVLQKEDCENLGFYRKVEFDIIEVNNPYVYTIRQPSMRENRAFDIIGFEERDYNFIDLPNKLIEIQIEVKDEEGKKKLIITHYSQEYLANKFKVE